MAQTELAYYYTAIAQRATLGTTLWGLWLNQAKERKALKVAKCN